MDENEWRRRRSPASTPAVSPFLQRIGILLLAFVLLLPIARLIDRSDRQTVKATGLPGATVGAVTEAPTSSAPTTVAPDTAAAAAPAPTAAAAPQTTPSSAAAPAATAAKKPVATTAKKPVTTAAKKPVATTVKKSAPTTAAKKPVATTVKPKPPATTAPKPAPPAAPPAATYTPAQVEQIIRDIWPDDLEDHALAIAKRESRLNPASRNYCCYGLFAIYYEAGKRLLNSIGVMSADQLLDPYVNTRAAVAIYQVAGWDPWKL